MGGRGGGEGAAAAAAVGVGVRWRGCGGRVCGGLLAGVAGAHLALDSGTFVESMSAGRGFIAIAVVALGRWSPIWVVAAAFFFGAVSALQFFLQALGWEVPFPLFLALPYLLTLAALAGWVCRSRAPAALALRWPPESTSWGFRIVGV